ncbi:MAG: MBL fold metallo-hydrolase [Patescibacteria group bacterium]
MAKVDVLIRGYAVKQDKGERASSTAVLVRDGSATVLVDPGINRQSLSRALEKVHVQPEEITHVLVTHYHPDHAYGAAWFPEAILLDNDCRYEGDAINDHDGFIPGTELAIMKTPGHAPEHCSLAVPTEQGMVVIAGDVFWWYDAEEQSLALDRPDPFAQDRAQLRESREKVLKLADIIIPGHGDVITVQ